MEEVDEIAHRPCSIPISCSLKLNMDGLLERIWDMMALVRRLGCTTLTMIQYDILETHLQPIFYLCDAQAPGT
jgi:hypothetical protein